MSTTFRPYAPDQSLLLPPDVREWLPEGHLAHHISDLVDDLDLTAFLRLFCVGGPEGSRRGCERHGKSYLTRRRRGEEGDGGGSLTGGAIPSA